MESGECRREHGSMGESDQFGRCGRSDSSIGLMQSKGRTWGRRRRLRKVKMPQFSVRPTGAGEDRLVVVVNLNNGGIEGDITSSVA
jgi:hypothetical protein